MKLRDKRVLLGVTGSIAAYKTAELVRLLVKEGAEVQVVMTESAHDFVTAVTLSTLSGKPVLTRFSDSETGTWNNHVEMGMWADAFVLAPLTANTLAKMVQGRSDNLLTAIYLSAKCPVFAAPAMDLDMFAHPASQDNIKRLESFGCHIIGPDSGQLASGLEGEGRMTEPDQIVRYLALALGPEPRLLGKKVLVSAGPTREPIDPVRYISNHSSGKMGVAIAVELALRGANVHLVAGPGVKIPHARNIHAYQVTTAAEMHDVCMSHFSDALVTVMAAAVADFTPENTAAEKQKKQEGGLQLSLRPTADILAEMGSRKQAGQLLVGFALETTREMDHAVAKLKRKNLDFIVLNSLNDAGAGFHTDTNKVTLIDRLGNTEPGPLKSKKEVAADIAAKIISMLNP